MMVVGRRGLDHPDVAQRRLARLADRARAAITAGPCCSESAELALRVLFGVQDADDRHVGSIHAIEEDVLPDRERAKAGPQLVPRPADARIAADRGERLLQQVAVGIYRRLP